MKRIPNLRLGMYGLLLWSSAHCAVAADELANLRKPPAAPPAHALPVAARNFALVQTQATDSLGAFPRSDFQVAMATVPTADVILVEEGDLARLLALTVDQRVLGALRDGVGVNFSMGDLGGLHLNLYSRRNPRGPGQRWNLNPAGPDAAASAPRFWSLGGALDLVHHSAGGRQLVFVPQLQLDFAALTGSRHGFQVFMQYANWRPGPGEATLDESVPQVAMKLRF